MTGRPNEHKSWRWPEVAESLVVAARRVPQNVSAWRDLSQILSILGEHEAALRAAQQGLSLPPRDDDMLRIQFLALKAQKHSADLVDAASQAYEDHRRGDRPTLMRARCASKVSECSQERLSVHAHKLNANHAGTNRR